MATWLIRISISLIALFAILIAGAWMVLASPFFSNFRQDIVADVLTEQLGYPVEILDDVSVAPGRTSKVYASEVQILSENIDDFVLAELGLLELEVDVFMLADGIIDLDNIKVEGLRANALTRKDGVTSWTKPTQPLNETNANSNEDSAVQVINDGDILDFLRYRTASFSSIQLEIDNRTTGFVFEFDLKNLNLDQVNEGKSLGVNGLGTVNGQEFRLEGNYPTDAPFTTTASFGDLVLTFDGAAILPKDGGGYSGKLELDTGSFAEFLEVLRLDAVLEGSGNLQADLTSQPGLLRVTNLSSEIELDQGQLFEVKGKIDNLMAQEGVDVDFSARFHPEGQPPPNAKKLQDIKLKGIYGHIVSNEHALEFEELVFSTNAFDQGLDEIGPITIGHLSRTPEDQLAMRDINFQAGPLNAPFINARGDILNLLELKDIDINGTMSVPATLVLDGLPDDVAEAFGSVNASFEIDDKSGLLSLGSLDAFTVDTDVWALSAQMALRDVENLGNFKLDLDLDIADGAYFLKTLQLKEIDTGRLELSASIRGDKTEVSTHFGLGAGGSRLDTYIDVALPNRRPVISGRIVSEKIDVDDLRDAVAGAIEVGKIGNSPTEETSEEDELELQPLVLAKLTDSQPEEYEDGLELQPLILPKRPPKLADLFDLETLLLQTDLRIDIAIDKLTGQQGVSSIASALVAHEGKAELGPINVTYGKGFINVGASMDMVKSPELVSVSGTTKGWDFGNILNELGLGIKANGTLSGTFNVTGNRASPIAFVNSMFGSAAINMSGGRIASSLLELAGLGIFPWLFSNERKTGFTEIVCIAAPLTVNAGKVSSDRVVLETKSVQMVAKGYADWRKNNIGIRAEGRRVGKPLGRSAWPFDVAGKLSDPKFKVQVGGSRSKRADGAKKMPTQRIACVPDILQLQ